MGACASVHGATGVGSRSIALGPSPSILPTREFDDVRARFTFEREIARGMHYVINRVVEKATGLPFACKSISKVKMLSMEELHDTQMQIKIQKHVSTGHPNVAQFLRAYEDQHRVHVVAELCTGGDLFDHITNAASSTTFTERTAAKAFHGVVAAVQHFHSMNVIHRDIRPENFMFKDSSQDAQLKCIDFESAMWNNKDNGEVVGTPHYIAPEMLLRDAGTHITGQVDVWSAGVLLYVLLVGYPPFNGSTNEQVFESVVGDPLNLKSDPWPRVSPAAKELVRKMLLRNPKRRYTPEQVLGHRWFTEQAAASELPEAVVLQRMRQFAAFSQFKKEALRVLAGGLPDAELEGMLQMFRSIDRDASGAISVREMRNTLKRSGMNVGVTEVGALLHGVDIDGDHMVDYGEFIAATMRDIAAGLSERDSSEHMMAAFQQFDLDSSGYIDRHELMTVLRSRGQDVSEDDVARMMAEADTNYDGKVDYAEFSVMVLACDARRQEGRTQRIDMLESRRIRLDRNVTNKLRSCCAANEHDGTDGGAAPAAAAAAAFGAAAAAAVAAVDAEPRGTGGGDSKAAPRRVSMFPQLDADAVAGGPAVDKQLSGRSNASESLGKHGSAGSDRSSDRSSGGAAAAGAGAVGRAGVGDCSDLLGCPAALVTVVE